MLIGLNGRLRAGKDTAAERIEHVLGQPVKRMAFADPLKNSAAALLGITREELENMKLWAGNSITVTVPTINEKYRSFELTGRQYLERFGTEAHRDIFGQTFWLDQGVPVTFDHSDGIYVVTDCRFVNEAERIREVGGIVAEIVGPDGREGNGHISDRPLPNDLIDVFVNNTVRDDGFANLDRQLKLAVELSKHVGVAA